MTRLACLLAVLVLALPAAAVAQDNPFGPLPAGPPEETPEPTATPAPVRTDEGVSRGLLLGIGGALIVVFVVIGTVITRDARSSLPEDARDQRPRDQGPHRHERDAKAKARAKARASRQARKTTRRRAR